MAEPENGSGNASRSSDDGVLECKNLWKVALQNDNGKYLSAEVFTFAINASSKAMKKHQIWSIVPDAVEPDTFYLRSFLKRYLTSDRNGVVKCLAEGPSAEGKFIIERNNEDSNSIKWAFKSVHCNAYFSGVDDQLGCTSRKAVWWSVTMVIHPHVYLHRAARLKYAVLRDGELQFTENVPIGINCLVKLERFGCRVGVRAADRRFLQLDGSLDEQPELFRVEFRSGLHRGVVFRAQNGCFLGCSGTKSALKVGKNDSLCTKDEVFVIESSHPQLTFRACSTGKFVSRRQTTDLSANQTECQGDEETFQLEYVHAGSGKWRLRDSANKVWTVVETGAINLTNSDGEQTLFEVHYDSQDRMALKASNGRFVSTMKNGRLSASSSCTDMETVSENELFWTTLVNRNELAFQGDHGYVVLKNEKQGKLECNLAHYQVWSFQPTQNGLYRIFDERNRGWKLCDDGFICTAAADQADAFSFQFKKHSKIAIRAPNAAYLKGEQNGMLKACASLEDAHLWEI